MVVQLRWSARTSASPDAHRGSYHVSQTGCNLRAREGRSRDRSARPALERLSWPTEGSPSRPWISRGILGRLWVAERGKATETARGEGVSPPARFAIVPPAHWQGGSDDEPQKESPSPSLRASRQRYRPWEGGRCSADRCQGVLPSAIPSVRNLSSSANQCRPVRLQEGCRSVIRWNAPSGRPPAGRPTP
jgi:transposase